VDYSQLSDEDLVALKKGEYGLISDAGLQALRQPGPETAPGFDAGEMVSNIPSSAYKMGMDMLNAVTNPMDTLKSVGGLVESGVERLNPFAGEEDYQYQQYPQAVGEAITERYGSGDAALNTLQTDPVGVLADVSGAVSGAGAATRMPALSKVGRALDPINMPLNAIKAAGTAAIPKGAPASMYESAAKYPATGVTRTHQAREAATETALKNKIMPTESGINKISLRLEEFDSNIDDLISEAQTTGKKIPKARIFDELPELRRNLSKGVGGPENLAASDRVVRRFKEMHENGPDLWSPKDMQDLKTATYRDINWRVDPDASTETMQAMARGARKSLADLSPELDLINKQYGPLAHLRESLQRPSKRIGNLNLMGISAPLMAAGGGAVGDTLGAAAGLSAGLAMNPHIMAKLALIARGAQETGPLGQITSGSSTAQMIRQGLLQSGRLEEIMEE